MENLNELFTALCAAQAEMKPALKKSKNPFYKSNYSDLAEIWEALKEPLTKHGLSIIQLFEKGEGDGINLKTVLGHKSGQSIVSLLPLPIGQKRDPQSIGSLMTYCRRYSLAAICGLPTADDDGEEAQQEHRLTATQLEEIKIVLNGDKKKADQILSFFHITKFSDLPASKFNACMKLIQKEEVAHVQ